MKAKILIDTKTMNKVIKAMAKYENKKAKLNAGQKREGLKAVLNAIYFDLSQEEKLNLVSKLIKSI